MTADLEAWIDWKEENEICLKMPAGAKTPKRNLKIGEHVKPYMSRHQKGEHVIYGVDSTGKILTFIRTFGDVPMNIPPSKFTPANEIQKTVTTPPEKKEEIKECTSPATLPAPIPMAARTVTLTAHVNLSNYENIQVQVSQVCNNQLDRENLIKYLDETLGMFGSDEQTLEMIGSYRRRMIGIKGVE